MKIVPLALQLPVLRSDVSFPSAALAATAPVSAGVIHFKGQIVSSHHGYCNLAPSRRNIEVSCSRNNIIPICRQSPHRLETLYFVDEWNRHGTHVVKRSSEIQSLIVQYRYNHYGPRRGVPAGAISLSKNAAPPAFCTFLSFVSSNSDVHRFAILVRLYARC